MKKRLILITAMTGAVCLLALGCSNKNIDTNKVRAAFQSLSGGPKDTLEQALQNIDHSNYVAAVRPLRTIAYKVKLDKTQSAILDDTIAKAQALAAKQK